MNKMLNNPTSRRSVLLNTRKENNFIDYYANVLFPSIVPLASFYRSLRHRLRHFLVYK